MKTHIFLLEPKQWLGEGKITLSMVEEELDFYTCWKIGAKSPEGEIEALQEVEIKGMSDMMLNHFIFKDLTSKQFNVELENATLGKIVGGGHIKDDVIAWEFRHPELGFDGFEFYEPQEDGSYLMRAEYATPDQHRTTIRGKIWEKL